MSESIRQQAAAVRADMDALFQDFQFAGSESSQLGRVVQAVRALAECLEGLDDQR